MSLFGLEEKKLYGIINSVNPEAPFLRDNMMYGLLSHVVKNHKFFDDCKLFDIGKVWKKE
jgi:phenylalanyl-tRNA synthetase beta subunit